MFWVPVLSSLNSPRLLSTNLPVGIDFPHLRECDWIRERPEPPCNYTSDAGRRDRQREGERITWNVHLLQEDHSSPARLCVAVYPGAVSLQHSLIHSISLFVGARVCSRRRQEREGWRVITGTSCCSLIGHLLCHGAGPQPSYISWEGWRGPDTTTHLSATHSKLTIWLKAWVQSVSSKLTSKLLQLGSVEKFKHLFIYDRETQYW